MGCSNSTNNKNVKNDVNLRQLIKTNAKSSLALYDGSNSIQAIPIVGNAFRYSVKYSYGSQRGFYPDGK